MHVPVAAFVTVTGVWPPDKEPVETVHLEVVEEVTTTESALVEDTLKEKVPLAPIWSPGFVKLITFESPTVT